VQTLRDEGAAVVFISHRLEEVLAICQRVTVLRDGRLVLSQPLAGVTEGELVRAMVGRDVVAESHTARQAGKPVLEVEHLTREGVFVDISFEVRAGEVVALAGLVGSGRSEVARAIFGIDRYDAGTVTMAGRALRRGSPASAMQAGIGFVPEDRRQQGLVMDLSVARNIGLASLKRLRHGGLIFTRTERRFGADWAQRLQVTSGRASMPVSLLSGGNQQKVVLAKWLSMRPKVLIFDEPTRGVDVGAKQEIYDMLRRLADGGVAILMISSDMEEVIGVSDRIAVMHEGAVSGFLDRSQFSEHNVLQLAVGHTV
jgi:rhamnose transport system ATP-binding protein